MHASTITLHIKHSIQPEHWTKVLGRASLHLHLYFTWWRPQTADTPCSNETGINTRGLDIKLLSGTGQTADRTAKIFLVIMFLFREPKLYIKIEGMNKRKDYLSIIFMPCSLNLFPFIMFDFCSGATFSKVNLANHSWKLKENMVAYVVMHDETAVDLFTTTWAPFQYPIKCLIVRSSEATILVVLIITSLWNLISTSVALQSDQIQLTQFQDFARPYNTSYQILKWNPVVSVRQEINDSYTMIFSSQRLKEYSQN